MEDSPGNREPLRILMLEDVPADAELTLRELRRMGIEFVSQRVATREEFERAVREFRPDLILSDFSLPGSFDGLAALDIARSALPDIPYIFVSGTIGEDRAVEAMKRGATDYVLKDRLNRLVPVVKRALEEKQERDARRRAEAELEEARSRLQSVIGSLRDIVWSYSFTERRVHYISEAVEEICGRPAAEFYADPRRWFEMVIHPEDRARVKAAREESLAARRFEVVYRIVRPDGGIRWIQDRAQIVVAADGTPLRMDGLARDVTEAKAQSDRIARLNRMLAVLSGINSIIMRVNRRDELFREACRIAVEEGGFEAAWVGLLDADGACVQPGFWAGRDTDFLPGVRLAVREDLPGAHNISGIAMRTRQPVIVNDIREDARVALSQELLSRGFLAAATLPLTVGNDVAGVLVFYSGEAGSFDEEQARLLADLAGDVSFALDHMAKSERLDYLAYFDPLTGLPNRALLQERLTRALHRAKHTGERLAVLIGDIARFRLINETLGRQAGDELLRGLAQRFRQVWPDADNVARVGSNEIAGLLVDVKQPSDVAHFLENALAGCLAPPFRIAGEELRVTMTGGIAVYPDDGADADTLLVNAEAALKQAKSRGERYLFYRPAMNASVAENLRLENRLRRALEKEQFLLHYQPKIDFASGEIRGLEALIRWVDPERGLVSPDKFIPILEETGMIVEAGYWAIRCALADARAWRGRPEIRVAVNVSAAQLRQKDFVRRVQEILDEHRGTIPGLDLEITESLIMQDIDGNIEKLGALRAMGVNVAIDDFGTGYSSLGYLAKLPVTALKIDRSFVDTMVTQPDSMTIVSTIISLAHALHLRVIAEGVETEEQAKFLKLLKCDEMQGYLFSRPLPAGDIAQLLAT